MSAASPDWRAVVRAQARRGSMPLPDATVEELAGHLEALYEAALARGAGPEEAAAETRRALDPSSLHVLRGALPPPPARGPLGLATAARAAVIQFRRHRGFATLAVLMLGLSIGAATAIFSVVDAVVLRPLPYADPERLVTLWDTNTEKGLAREPISPVNFMDQRALPVFTDAAAWWRPGVNLTDTGLDPVRVSTVETSGNLFAVLGVRPQIGPGFPDAGPLFHPSERIAVISDRLWRTRYGAEPTIVGRTLLFNRVPYTVVGVMPPRFHFPDDVDVWQRLEWDMTQHSRAAHFMEAVARTADGVTAGHVQSALDALAARWQEAFARTNRGWGTRVVPLLDDELGYYRPALLLLFGASGLLLLIGVFNVASVLLTRAVTREREIATRIALGASGRQIVQQLFAESVALSAAGAVVGALAAGAAVPLAAALTPVAVPRLDEAAVGVRAVAAAAVVAGGTTVIFGLVPALVLVRRRTAAPLTQGGRGSSRPRHLLHVALVSGQVALACALLAGSALLVRTVRHMMAMPLGVTAADTYVAPVQLTLADLETSGQQTRARWRAVADTYGRLLEAVRRQPGVVAAGSTNVLPMDGGWRNPFGIEGEPPPSRPEDAPHAQLATVSDGYFEAMGARLASGRTFAATDDAGRPGVVVVNEAFARRYLDGRAEGRTVRIWVTGIGPLGFNLQSPAPPAHDGSPFEVVGVVGDIRNGAAGVAIEPTLYFASRQFPFSEQALAVRAADRNAAARAMREAMREVAPTVPVGPLVSWPELVRRRTAEPRLLMAVLTAFGGLAAVLAALGVYGLFSWSVATRERELAIRLALGASPGGIGGLVLREGLLLAGAGLAAGWLIVRASEGALRHVVIGVSTADAPALLAAAGVLLGAAMVACVPPAVRAMRVDPTHSLRAE
jgi:putative ABC transport system permease protein